MRSACFFIFCLLTIDCYPQQAESHTPLILSNVSEQNGLSDDHVKCVLKDKDNFVWIGTADGLNLMDGSTIKVFRHAESDSSTLPSSDIITLTEDAGNDMLYIGTNKGICWYDKKKKTFTSALPPLSPYGSSLDIVSILIAGNNQLWCCTDGGLFLFEKNERRFTSFYNTSTEEGSEPKYSNKLTSMQADNKGKLWISSNDGLWRFDTSNKTFKKIIHKNNDPVYHPLCEYVIIDHEQNIWAGFWNTGLKKYNTTTSELTDFGSAFNHQHTVSRISEIRRPGNNYILWLDGDLLAFDEKTNSYFNFQPQSSEKKIPLLNPLYQSADGWLWLGSDKGLYIYNPQRQLFNHFVFSGGITSQGISFYNYKNGFLTGAENKDFLKWRSNNGEVLKDYSYLGGNTTLLCIRQAKQNDFWIGTAGGILHANFDSRNATWFKHKEGDSTSLPRDFVSCLFIDSKQNLWVFPWREGIWQMDKQTGKCKMLLEGFIPEVNKTKRLLISDAAEDANGNIWMCDLDEGIILYNATTKQFTKPFEKSLGPKYGTARIFIKNRTAYSFVSNAIIKWNIDSMVVTTIPLPAEMDKGLTDMIPDHSGNWWMTSRNGLIVFNENEKSFNRFTTADGLVQNDINGSIFCASDGTMWIGTPAYFTSFDPALLIRSSFSKKNAVVTGVWVNNKPIEWNHDQLVSLSYRENNIVVRWALPDYSNPFRNQYYVKLKSIDEDWRPVGNTGEVQYANLSPGNYKLELKAATANGVSSENNIDMNFIIHPPVWKEWWFITLVSIVFITAFIIIIRYVSQRNLKEKLLRLEKEQAIEKERNRISRDMHDDLGSGLTKIAILSEVVKKQIHEPEKAKQQLENISESSRELVDNLQDIIWVLNPKNDTLESLAAYIREYALKFFEPFETELKFDYPEAFANARLSEETRRNLFLVIKESFNNIAKHAWCNKVTVSIRQTNAALTIQIQDDGKGFDMGKTRQFANGLTNMKNRIEQIDGNYKIESGENKGTVTTIDLTI